MDLKVLLDMLNSCWLQKLVELRPTQNFGSNEQWDLGELWQLVFLWYNRVRRDKIYYVIIFTMKKNHFTWTSVINCLMGLFCF